MSRMFFLSCNKSILPCANATMEFLMGMKCITTTAYISIVLIPKEQSYPWLCTRSRTYQSARRLYTSCRRLVRSHLRCLVHCIYLSELSAAPSRYSGKKNQILLSLLTRTLVLVLWKGLTLTWLIGHDSFVFSLASPFNSKRKSARNVLIYQIN